MRPLAALAPDPAEAARVVAAVIDEMTPRLRVEVANLPLCQLPGHEEANAERAPRNRVLHADRDLAALARLAAERRVKKAVCVTCAHAVACPGFVELDGAPAFAASRVPVGAPALPVV